MVEQHCVIDLTAKRTFDSLKILRLAIADWAETNGVDLELIKPARPMQNGFIEGFNRSYREAVTPYVRL